jgi:Cu(I)/Ag(I) efflux system membrane protein CusA/SilA
MVIYYEKNSDGAWQNRWKFMTIPILTILFGIVIRQGFDKTFGPVAKGFETVMGGNHSADRFLAICK